MTAAEAATARILVIDDSKLMRGAAVKMLGQDFDVQLAEDGEAGWERIQQDTALQLVFTDLNMPNMDGYELLERVRTCEDEGIRNLPVVVVTGADNDEEARERALSLGATDFITKPFNSTEIRARARAYSDYQRSTRTLERTAHLDAQTGLPDRSGLEQRLSRDRSFCLRHQAPLAVMLVELYDFNSLFLKIGRKGAESILQHVGSVLQQAVRREDSVGRLGLACYGLVLPTAKPDHAQQLAERIRERVHRASYKLRGEPLTVDLCLGLAVSARLEALDASELLQRAESALAAAREVGAGGIHCELDESQPSPAQSSAAQRISLDEYLALLERDDTAAVTAAMPAIVDALSAFIPLMDERQRKVLMKQLLD